LILIFAAVLFGQGVTGGQKSSLPAPSSASPSVVPQGASTPSNVSTITGATPDPLAEANRHSRRGEFDAAIQSYNAVLQKNPKSPDAYAGLTRVYLKQKEVDHAYEIATQGLKVTNSPSMDAALGEVLFRQGKIS